MKRLAIALLAFLGAHGFLAPAPAQAQGPRPRPAVDPNYRFPVSPYLNLLRRGQPAGLNYYNLVLPEVTFQNNIGALQQQITRNQSSITQLEETPSTLPDTGHPVQFMSHGRFFMNSGSGGGTRTASQAAIRAPSGFAPNARTTPAQPRR